MAALLQTRAGRAAAGVLAVLAVAVLAAGAAMWPGERAPAPRDRAGALQDAEVTGLSARGCERLAGPRCTLVAVTLRSGPDAGRGGELALSAGAFAPELAVGDRIRVFRTYAGGKPLPLGSARAPALTFDDFDRGRPLLLLALGFAALVALLARWQGVRSLAGLGLSLLVVVGWLVPAILDGHPPLLAALAGGLAVMLVTTALSHGLGLKSAALAVLAVDVAHITGLSSEDATLLEATGERGVSIRGLVLAGIVVGALGVLDDVTVSQASTVLALRRADPAMPVRRLFREAMAVGRDHLGATVNTLVLAYAGASLPVLLIFATQGTGFSGAATGEAVAQEIVATLVGSTGLLLAVPLTTALAAWLATRVPARALPAEAQHVHR